MMNHLSNFLCKWTGTQGYIFFTVRIPPIPPNSAFRVYNCKQTLQACEETTPYQKIYPCIPCCLKSAMGTPHITCVKDEQLLCDSVLIPDIRSCSNGINFVLFA